MRAVWVAPVLVLGLAGCGTMGAIDVPLGAADATAPPAAAAPTDLTVATTPLQTVPLPAAGQPFPAATTPPPAATTTTPPAGGTTTPPAGGSQTAAPATPPAGPTTIGTSDLLGGWTVTSGGDTCRLFVALTGWVGGYRASTLGCTSALLSSISAWNLEGQTVVLFANGTPIAHLTAVSADRFQGTVDAGGAAISFFQ